MGPLTIKRNDVHDVQLVIGGAPVDMQGGTVKVFVKPSISGDVLPFDATLSGNVVTWSLDGTIPAGRYKLEVQVTVGSYVVTAPSKGYMELVVLEDLG